jgi:predicted ribosome quality control (RQC) complex YloA/Tae2 family protein
MYKNYFYLNRLVIELNRFLPGARLFECFSQESDRLVLRIESGQNEFALIMNAKQNESFITKRDQFHKAKKNVLNFFGNFLPAIIKKVFIAEDDRIMLFMLDTGNLYFTVRGKDSNAIFVSSYDIVLSFKKLTEDLKTKLIKELSSKRYTSEYNLPDINNGTEFQLSDKGIIKKYPAVSKEIIKEAMFRYSNNPLKEQRRILNECIEEINNERIKIYYDNFLDEMLFKPETYFSRHEDQLNLFDNYLDAVNFFITISFKKNHSENLEQIIDRNLTAQISKLSSKLNELKNKLETPSRENEFRETGNYLLINIHNIKKGMTQLEMNNNDEEKHFIATLDPSLSPKQNIDKYFEKARDEKEKLKHYNIVFQDSLKKYNKLLAIQEEFKKSESVNDLQKIMDELKIKPDNEKQTKEEQYNFKHYLIDGKYHLFVGRNSKNNDELTTKFARQNDFWFHARSVSGSHTVLRVENSKEAIPKAVLKKAASIAAFHSKAKTAGLAPVSYTFKKYVVKKKGMDIGAVSLLKEEVLLVKPEIPGGCEFISE